MRVSGCMTLSFVISVKLCASRLPGSLVPEPAQTAIVLTEQKPIWQGVNQAASKLGTHSNNDAVKTSNYNQLQPIDMHFIAYTAPFTIVLSATAHMLCHF